MGVVFGWTWPKNPSRWVLIESLGIQAKTQWFAARDRHGNTHEPGAGTPATCDPGRVLMIMLAALHHQQQLLEKKDERGVLQQGVHPVVF